MTDHRFSPQVSRIEMVEVGRRRRWSTAAKLRIVAESFAEPRRVAATARQHGISRALLTTWRRAYRAGRLGADTAPDFLPVTVTPSPVPAAPEAAPAAKATPHVSDAGRIEIVLVNGRRIVVGADVDAAALARVVTVLERQ
jgi:transposase